MKYLFCFYNSNNKSFFFFFHHSYHAIVPIVSSTPLNTDCFAGITEP